MADIVLTVPVTTTVERDGLALVAQARTMKVHDEMSYQAAGEFVKKCAAGEKQVAEMYAGVKKSAFDAHKMVCAEEKKYGKPFAEARCVVAGVMTTYEEAKRREAEAEARRLADEARKREEERMLSEAGAAEKAGDSELAQEILSSPVSVPTVTVTPATPKVDGVSSRYQYGAEVTDMLAFIRYVIANPSMFGLLDVNRAALNSLARSMRDTLNIPGVVVSKKLVQVVRP